MKITKRLLKRIIREEKRKILESFDDDQYGYGPPVEDASENDSNLDRETKASMVMEAVQQNLNNHDFVNWLFEELGLGE